MWKNRVTLINRFSCLSILMILGTLLFSASNTEDFRLDEKHSTDSSISGDSSSRHTSKSIAVSEQAQGQLSPVQIPEGAWPKKEAPGYHLEKVTNPLVALQIAASKNDQDSIDH